MWRRVCWQRDVLVLFAVVPVKRRQCLRPRNRRLSHSDATSPIGSNRRGCVCVFLLLLFYFTSSAFVDYVFTDKRGTGKGCEAGCDATE